MTQDIKAIETRYKGYRFRSRLEARWAVFFDSWCVPWEYEREGYELGKLGRYLPDFWLTDMAAWVEIKPSIPDPCFTKTEPEILMEELVKRSLTGNGFIFFGMPGDDLPGAVFYVKDGEYIGSYRTGDILSMIFAPCPCCGEDKYLQKRRSAIDAAKSARFEFGESGVS